MKLRLLILLALVFVLTMPVMASTYVLPKAQQTYQYLTAPGAMLFNGQELSIDIGCQYTTQQGHTVFDSGGGKGAWGIDGSLTYWIKPEFGLGTSAGIIDTHEQNILIVDHWDFVTLNGRLPLSLLGGTDYFSRHFAIEADICPFGKDFQNGNYRLSWDAGVEWRWTQHLGFASTYGQTYEEGTFVKNNENIKFALVLAF